MSEVGPGPFVDCYKADEQQYLFHLENAAAEGKNAIDKLKLIQKLVQDQKGLSNLWHRLPWYGWVKELENILTPKLRIAASGDIRWRCPTCKWSITLRPEGEKFWLGEPNFIPKCIRDRVNLVRTVLE